MTSKPHIVIIVASTRTVRFADHALTWLLDRLSHENKLTFEVLDLRDHPLPYYDLTAAPAMAHRQYATEGERLVGEVLDKADGFLVIVNEYNHGYTAPLKNTLDHFFIELNHKPISFLGYGNVGGSRAIEQLRLVVAELDMASVRPTVHIFGPQMAAIREGGEAATAAFAIAEPRLDALIADLHWWASALQAARSEIIA